MTARVPTRRVAILVFANSAGADLARRGWTGRAAPLLRMPRCVARGMAGADVHLFTDLPGAAGTKPAPGVRVHLQRGHTFGERLAGAVDELAAAGYGRVVIVGRDCPDLTSADIRSAARQLDRRKLVIGPDHRGGCYLIALRVEDRAILRDVPWQRDIDRAALLHRCGPGETAVLGVKCDVDTWGDVARLGVTSGRWAAFARSLLAPQNITDTAVGDGDTPVLRIDGRRRRWQLPPPAGFLHIRVAG